MEIESFRLRVVELLRPLYKSDDLPTADERLVWKRLGVSCWELDGEGEKIVVNGIMQFQPTALRGIRVTKTAITPPRFDGDRTSVFVVSVWTSPVL